MTCPFLKRKGKIMLGRNKSEFTYFRPGCQKFSVIAEAAERARNW